VELAWLFRAKSRGNPERSEGLEGKLASPAGFELEAFSAASEPRAEILSAAKDPLEDWRRGRDSNLRRLAGVSAAGTRRAWFWRDGVQAAAR